MKIKETTVLPAAEPARPEIQHPPPSASVPDRDEKEYLEWRQELL